MLTIQKIINLITYYILFLSNLTNNKIVDNPSYIKEKFNIFFKEKPNMKLIRKNSWDNVNIWNNITDYTVLWNIETNDFLNSEEFPYYVFTLELILLDNLNLNNIISKLLNIYNLYYDNYDSISNENLIVTVHQNLRGLIENIIDNNKLKLRTILLKKLLNKK